MERKRFVAQREVEFPELCERLVATFPGDLWVRRKERDGRMVIKPNFEVAYVGRICRLCSTKSLSVVHPNTYCTENSSQSLVVFDTLGLRAALQTDFKGKSGCEVDSDEVLVVKITCTIRDSKCTIL